MVRYLTGSGRGGGGSQGADRPGAERAARGAPRTRSPGPRSSSPSCSAWPSPSGSRRATSDTTRRLLRHPALSPPPPPPCSFADRLPPPPLPRGPPGQGASALSRRKVLAIGQPRPPAPFRGNGRGVPRGRRASTSRRVWRGWRPPRSSPPGSCGSGSGCPSCRQETGAGRRHEPRDRRARGPARCAAPAAAAARRSGRSVSTAVVCSPQVVCTMAHRLVALADDPLVAPLAQRDEHRPQRLALVGEHVVVAARGPRRSSGARARRASTSVSSRVGQDVAGDAEPLLELLEAGDAEEGVAQDQQRPPLADHLERAGDRAVHLLERGSAHAHDRSI